MHLGIVFAVMLVLLGTMLLQVKARIVLAQGSGKELTRGQRLMRYLCVTLVWAAITVGVMLFAINMQGGA